MDWSSNSVGNNNINYDFDVNHEADLELAELVNIELGLKKPTKHDHKSTTDFVHKILNEKEL